MDNLERNSPTPLQHALSVQYPCIGLIFEVSPLAGWGGWGCTAACLHDFRDVIDYLLRAGSMLEADKALS